MLLNKILRPPVGADNAVSKINTDYEIRLVCCSGFFYNPHLFLKLHYRAHRRLIGPRWLFRHPNYSSNEPCLKTLYSCGRYKKLCEMYLLIDSTNKISHLE